MKVFIINYNRLTSTRNMVEYLLTLPDADPVILDNASTYPPLLRWYQDACPVEVVLGVKDFGPRVLWADRRSLVPSGEVYAVTDSDLDLSGCPADLLQHLTSGLDKYPEIRKVGVSLALEDIPDDNPLQEFTLDREARYWEDERDDEFYNADVATTLAVYRSHDGQPPAHYGPALRSKAPYQARHLPWYLTPSTMTHEDRYYLDRVNPAWTGIVFSRGLQKHLDTLGPANYKEDVTYD